MKRVTRPGHLGLPGVSLFLAVALSAFGISACGALNGEPEPGNQVRAQLVPTYTPLPPPTDTRTPEPHPSATPIYAPPTPDEFEMAGQPVKLDIPAIGVTANVERVGRLPNGEMDVPHIPQDVAWFEESALPGQSGKTSLINGHLDSPRGPAVFYELRKLIPGDEIAVTYESGARYVFVVEDKERYAFDTPPMQKILGETPRRMLNLVTCDGVWDGGESNYQQRLVVYSRLKDS